MFLVIHGHLVQETYIFNSLGITIDLVVIVVNRPSKVASCLTKTLLQFLPKSMPLTATKETINQRSY